MQRMIPWHVMRNMVIILAILTAAILTALLITLLASIVCSNIANQMKKQAKLAHEREQKLAMDLQSAYNEQRRIRLDAEEEKMRGTLLRAISHDLRTPLSGILSASSLIREHGEVMEPAKIKQLAADITDNSEFLIRMVENLLIVTRISEGSVKVHKSLEIAEESMAHAVSIVRRRFPECNIHVEAPSEPLLVPIDGVLITQVLINLLENAVKNSPVAALVHVALHKKGPFAQFVVSDTGGGIPESILSSLFETNAVSGYSSTDTVHGMGIGLSICKTIVNAHGGKITGTNKKDGGARFSVWLPLSPGGLP